MRKQRGYYAITGAFVPDAQAEDTLTMDRCEVRKVETCGMVLLISTTVVMITTTLSILTFRLLMTTAKQYTDDPFFNPASGPIIGAILNTIWISIMNVVYRKLAVLFNDLENHRTDGAHENALIIKVFLFQFCNSYGALFYLAFVKSLSISLFDSFGMRDNNDEAYKEMCGSAGGGGLFGTPGEYSEACDANGECRYLFVQGDCSGALAIQLFSYLAIAPCYQLPLQIYGPRIAKYFAEKKRAERIQEATSTTGSMASSRHLFTLARRHVVTMSLHVVTHGRHLFTTVEKSIIINRAGDPKKALGMDIEHADPPHVRSLADGSIAGKSGVLPGDVIAAVNGQQVDGCQDALEKFGAADGEKVTVMVKRTTVTGREPADDEEKARWDFLEEVEAQMLLPRYAGTFNEYQPKVLQFGYVAMFSSLFPVGAIFAAVANIIEIRVDAYNVIKRFRRPRAYSSDGIGNWQVAISVLSWLAILINVRPPEHLAASS
jgi:hypothetical protein